MPASGAGEWREEGNPQLPPHATHSAAPGGLGCWVLCLSVCLGVKFPGKWGGVWVRELSVGGVSCFSRGRGTHDPEWAATRVGFVPGVAKPFWVAISLILVEGPGATKRRPQASILKTGASCLSAQGWGTVTTVQTRVKLRLPRGTWPFKSWSLPCVHVSVFVQGWLGGHRSPAKERAPRGIQVAPGMGGLPSLPHASPGHVDGSNLGWGGG
jgi:hypothetical protein